MVGQQRYKSDYANRIRFEPTYASGNYVFVNRPPLRTSVAERLAAKDYRKLILKKHSLYCVLIVGSKYLKILHESVESSVSIYCASRVTQKGYDPDQPITRTVEPKPKSHQSANKQQNKMEVE